MFIQKGAEPYLYQAGDEGVLLIHGFTGSPAEFKPLAKYLYEKGYSVLSVRLPGHGTNIDDLNKTTVRLYLQSVEDGYNILNCLCKKVYVVGISLGALLAMKLAVHFAFEKLVVISAPIKIKDKRLPFVSVGKYFINYVQKKKRKYKIEDKYNISYDAYALNPLSELVDFIKVIKKELPQITLPVLIIQAKKEKTVDCKSADYIYDNISSTNKEIMWLRHSGHMPIIDCEKELVFDKIYEFLQAKDKGDNNE